MAISNDIISSLGAGSGINSRSLVEQLVEIEKAPKQDAIDGKRETYETQISDFGLMRSALATLQDAAKLLMDEDSFSAKNATFTDSAALVPSKLDDNAPVGDYTFEVLAIAKAQSLSTTTQFTEQTDAVGKGVMTFTFGEWDTNVPPEAFTTDTSKDAFNITIDDTNNSLVGLRDAINKADKGVQASIINDGSGYRLVITAPSGASNELQITVAEEGGSPSNTDASDLSRFAFAPGVAGANQQMNQNQVGADASLIVNGLTVSRSSNEIDDVLEGFEFSLTKAAPGEVLNVSIFEDKATAEESVRGFVDTFNAFLEAIEPLVGDNEETEEKGSLARDATAKGIITGIRNEIAAAIPGLDSGFTSLAAIGIRTEIDGTISIDEDTFTKAFDDNFDLVKALFAPETSSSDNKITVNSFGTQTIPGSYDVVITQDPEKGELVGAVAAGNILADLNSPVAGNLDGAANAGTLLTDLAGAAGTNTGAASDLNLVTNIATAGAAEYDFSISIDGVGSGTISLTPGVYADNNALAAHIQTQINADATLGAADVTVTHDGTGFVVSSITAGATSSVSVITAIGGRAAELGLDAGSVPVIAAGTPSATAYDFTIDVDGVTSGIISLTGGVSYTNAALASHIQTQINADPTLGAADVTVVHDGSGFVVTSNSTGSSSAVNNFVAIGSNAADLGLDIGSATPGYDAAAPNAYDFTINVDGTESGTISLTPGSYGDMDTLAAHIQSQINNDTALQATSSDVDVVWVTDHFEITSHAYGVKSKVTVVAVGASAADLGLDTGSSTIGKNVAGTFDGVSGFGIGNVLLPELNSDPYGLTLLIDPGATTSTINFSGGFGRELSTLLDQYLQSSGIIDTREDNLGIRIDGLDEDQEKLEIRITAFQARLQAQFLAMERILSSLNSSGGFLDGILDRLPFTARQN